MKALLYSAGGAALVAIAAFAGWRSARPRLPQPGQLVVHDELESQRRALVERDARRLAQADFERSLPSRVTLLRRELTEPGLRASRVAATGSHSQTARARLFYINGEVVRQGSYEFSERMTLRDAIEKAGGLNPRAAENRVTVLRAIDGKTRRLVVKMDDLVRPDDIISVPNKMF